MDLNNTQTRKRVYEILGKIMRGEDLRVSAQNFTTNNEMVELIEILTNNNPYFNMGVDSVEINYEKLLCDNPNTLGVYHTGEDRISYATHFIEAVAQNRANVLLLFNVVFHEQKHHYQDYFRKNSHLIDTIDFKKASDGIFDTSLDDNGIKELNKFAHNHGLIGKMITKRRLRELQFGAYLSDQSEIDARKNAYRATTKAYESIMNDPLCPTALKDYLTRCYDDYVKFEEKTEAENQKTMAPYKELDKRVKENLLKSVRAGKRLDGESYGTLLNGILNHITKTLTLHENLEIAKWALQNDYMDLVRLSNLSLDDISNITFDEKTKWPDSDKLPKGFVPSILLQTRKRVYPGIQELHKKGINGQSVNVVYIDQQNKFVFNHEEFKHLNYQYFDFNGYDLDEFHPYGVLSNLCGKNTGVAPNINLYYYSAYRWKENDKSMLECLLDVLQKLKDGKHIDVVGISGPLYFKKNKQQTPEQKKIDEMVEQIKAFGCVVIDGYRFLDDFTCCGLEISEQMSFENLDYVSWANEDDKLKPAFICKGQVIAEWQTTNEYVYQGTNCDSWPIAQCVGLFALCRQIDKNITYQKFVANIRKSLINSKIIDFQKCIENTKNNIKEDLIIK